ncbi:nucleotidyltransferase domain-containing protein [Sphingomonas hylomeconis]|uniref:Nucleotidyltransferase family protein n=1 Tax=Sphingomonas hylomeconis TaxID=1395958 RepID=A0ABV7T003_9SPHN|nr:nucleotidyltransferase family protein [Sphingomonas hylomeconis]
MTDGWLLARALRSPDSTRALDAAGWTDLLAIARAEQMIGTLAYRLEPVAKPPAVARILDDARASADHGRTLALWEAEAARRVLAPLGIRLVLLKGTAFVAADLMAGQGRSIGDLDILVPHASLDAVEAALLGAGWEWVKPDPYDDAYYRQWMHELPPLIHRDRDRMIDVHHTILPLTARITPDAAALLDGTIEVAPGLWTLSLADMIVHAAAHLFADGDLAGGMRNLWDVDRLCREFGEGQPDFYAAVCDRARHHGLLAQVERAFRLCARLYATPLTIDLARRRSDTLYLRRLTARDGWGRATRAVTRQAFYIRSHYLRMPPAMLARHLWTKWRKGGAGPSAG